MSDGRARTKFSILDKSKRLSAELQQLEDDMAALSKKTEMIAIVQRPVDPEYYKVIKDEFLKETLRLLLELLPMYERAAKDLLDIVNRKYSLNEDARTRDVRLFKTGKVKKQIGTGVDDQALAELARQLLLYYNAFASLEDNLHIIKWNMTDQEKDGKFSLLKSGVESYLKAIKPFVTEASISVTEDSNFKLLGPLLESRDKLRQVLIDAAIKVKGAVDARETYDKYFGDVELEQAKASIRPSQARR